MWIAYLARHKSTFWLHKWQWCFLHCNQSSEDVICPTGIYIKKQIPFKSFVPFYPVHFWVRADSPLWISWNGQDPVFFGGLLSQLARQALNIGVQSLPENPNSRSEAEDKEGKWLSGCNILTYWMLHMENLTGLLWQQQEGGVFLNSPGLFTFFIF